jgi:hypothetical protein
MAAVAMSSSVAFKQGVSLGKSEFSGSALRQAAAVSKGQNVAFAVRAAGYDAELIQTAVGLRSYDALCGCLSCILLVLVVTEYYSGVAMPVDITRGILSFMSSGTLHCILACRL